MCVPSFFYCVSFSIFLVMSMSLSFVNEKLYLVSQIRIIILQLSLSPKDVVTLSALSLFHIRSRLATIIYLPKC